MQWKISVRRLIKERVQMRKNRGLAVILFAILLQLCSSGMELLALGIGIVGLVVTLIDDAQKGV